MSGPQVAVVTGATAGVGRAIVDRFAAAGWRVGLIARDREALEAVKAEVEARGGEALVLPADVADAAAVREAARTVCARWDGIEVWVNDAMATVFGPVGAVTAEEFRRVTEVTYLGCVHGTMAALEGMRPRACGTIVQVGSALAFRSIPLQSAYCGAKHAIRGFTNALRTELLHEQSPIRLTVVELPAMNTPQFDWARTHMKHRPRPMGRVYQPEVAADAVWRAAHGRAREYWLGRTTIATIIGDILAPAWMDRYLASAWGGQAAPAPVSPDRRDNLDAPVAGLHRTRGSFGAEAHERAVLVEGQAMRLGVVAVGALAFLTAGWLLGRSRS